MEKNKRKSAKRPWTSSIDHDPGNIGNLLSGIEDGDAEARRVSDMLGFEPAALPVIDRGTIAGHPLSDKQTWQIVLADGRTISLETLYQYRVYAGVLCGAPRDVDSELTNAVKRARRIFPNRDGKPVVLPPIVYGGSFASSGDGEPGMPWRIVPKVCCIAEFECGKPARDPDECYSSLVAIWFQERLGLPEDARTLDEIKNIDWKNDAFDWTP